MAFKIDLQKDENPESKDKESKETTQADTIIENPIRMPVAPYDKSFPEGTASWSKGHDKKGNCYELYWDKDGKPNGRKQIPKKSKSIFQILYKRIVNKHLV